MTRKPIDDYTREPINGYDIDHSDNLVPGNFSGTYYHVSDGINWSLCPPTRAVQLTPSEFYSKKFLDYCVVNGLLKSKMVDIRSKLNQHFDEHETNFLSVIHQLDDDIALLAYLFNISDMNQNFKQDLFPIIKAHLDDTNKVNSTFIFKPQNQMKHFVRNYLNANHENYNKVERSVLHGTGTSIETLMTRLKFDVEFADIDTKKALTSELFDPRYIKPVDLNAIVSVKDIASGVLDRLKKEHVLINCRYNRYEHNTGYNFRITLFDLYKIITIYLKAKIEKPRGPVSAKWYRVDYEMLDGAPKCKMTFKDSTLDDYVQFLKDIVLELQQVSAENRYLSTKRTLELKAFTEVIHEKLIREENEDDDELLMVLDNMLNNKLLKFDQMHFSKMNPMMKFGIRKVLRITAK